MSFKHLNGSFNKFLTNLLGSTKEKSFKIKVSKPDFINIIFTDFFEKVSIPKKNKNLIDVLDYINEIDNNDSILINNYENIKSLIVLMLVII